MQFMLLLLFLLIKRKNIFLLILRVMIANCENINFFNLYFFKFLHKYNFIRS